MRKVIVSDFIVPEDNGIAVENFWQTVGYMNMEISDAIGMYIEPRERVFILGGIMAHGITFRNDEFVSANKMWRLLQEIHNDRCDNAYKDKVDS